MWKLVTQWHFQLRANTEQNFALKESYVVYEIGIVFCMIYCTVLLLIVSY